VNRGGTLIAGVVAVALLPASAGAATFEVDRRGDTGPNGCGNGGCTLREAIIAANNRAGADAVVLRSGRTYGLAIPGIDEDAAATGDLDVRGPTTIRASGRGRATVNANDIDRAFQVFARTRIARLVVTNGAVDSALLTDGGGIYASADLAITRARVTKNAAAGDGQGIQVAGADLRATRTSVNANFGYGIDQSGSGSIRGLGLRVLRNEDGGIFEDGAGDVRLERSAVSGNDLSGIQEFGAGGLALKRSSVVSNQDSGVQSLGGGRSTIVESTIARNETGGLGGGLFTDSRVTIKSSSLIRNDGLQGGGILAAAGAALRIVNSTVANNHSADDGGGIFADPGSDVTLNAVTVVRNESETTAGGLFLAAPDGRMRIDNSLIALNEAHGLLLSVDNCFNEGDPFQSGGHNLLSDDDLCMGFDAAGDRVRANPRVGLLRRNGGPTETVALKKGSPAIGKAGNDAPSRDQRGRKRDRRPDIGSFER
jgi:CSLREA domain-containing protein